jgi:hypothetical protein
MAASWAAGDVDQWAARPMTFEDDDLFAPRSAPVRVKTRKTPPMQDAAIRDSSPAILDSVPIKSLGCRCGAREEIKGDCPAALDCWNCRGLETMRVYVPRFTPPHTAGRPLTDHEREGMRLDRNSLPG